MRGIGGILYGDPGVGKSGVAAQFPGPLLGISCRELGFADLIDAGEIDEDDIDEEEVADWSELLSVLNNPGNAKTIVIDSLSGIDEFMRQKIIKDEYGGNKANFVSFSEGWRLYAPIYAEKLVNKLTTLRQKGIHVILIGHKRIDNEKNIIAADYKTASLDVEKWHRGVYTKWAQFVLFMTLDFSVRASKKWKGQTTEAKVEEHLDEDVERIFYTTNHPSHDAKNRLGLPTVIRMGESAKEAYNNLISEFPPKIKENLTNV